MEFSPFITLPGELRNRIWSLATVQLEGTDVSEKVAADEPGLLATCRQIRNEASSIYYAETTFCLDYDEVDRGISRAWLARIGGKRTRMIRTLRIRRACTSLDHPVANFDNILRLKRHVPGRMVAGVFRLEGTGDPGNLGVLWTAAGDGGSAGRFWKG